jgi:hypothetical protein
MFQVASMIAFTFMGHFQEIFELRLLSAAPRRTAQHLRTSIVMRRVRAIKGKAYLRLET